jgi:hypothetical protein
MTEVMSAKSAGFGTVILRVARINGDVRWRRPVLLACVVIPGGQAAPGDDLIMHC